MPVTELPSISQSVKSAIAEGSDHNDGAGLDSFLPEKKETPVVTETKVTTDPVNASSPKTLSESLTTISDEPPKEAVKTPVVEVPSDEQREGEKPAQYIKRLKQERADLANKVKQLQEASTKTPVVSEDTEALRKEIAERDRLLELTAFEKSPRFKEQFLKPIEKAQTSAKDLIGQFTDTKGVFERAMALEGKERMSFLREHLEDAAPSVFERLTRIDELNRDKESALSDQSEISKAALADQASTENAAVLKEFDSMHEDMAKRVSYYRGDGAGEFVKQARSLIDGTANPKDILAAAYFAPIVPKLFADLNAARAELTTLRARVAEDQGSRPTINGRGGDKGSTNGSLLVDGKLPSIKAVVSGQVAEAQGR